MADLKSVKAGRYAWSFVVLNVMLVGHKNIAMQLGMIKITTRTEAEPVLETSKLG